MAGVTIIVDGKPIAWQRAAPVMVAEFPIMKTPKRTRSYQELVKQLGKIAMGPRAPLWARSSSSHRHARAPKTIERNRPWVQHTGDVDNYAKSAQDALDGIAFNDDADLPAQERQALLRPGREANLRIEIYQLDVEDDDNTRSHLLCGDHHHRGMHLRRRRDHHRQL